MKPSRLFIWLLAFGAWVLMLSNWFDPEWRHQLSNAVIAWIVVGVLAGVGSLAYFGYQKWARTGQQSMDEDDRELLDGVAVIVVPQLPSKQFLFPIELEIRTGTHELRDVSMICQIESVKGKRNYTQTGNSTFGTTTLPSIRANSVVLYHCGQVLLRLIGGIEILTEDVQEAVVELQIESAVPGLVGRFEFRRKFRLERNSVGQLVFTLVDSVNSKVRPKP